jgi:hypothetical protein
VDTPPAPRARPTTRSAATKKQKAPCCKKSAGKQPKRKWLCGRAHRHRHAGVCTGECRGICDKHKNKCLMCHMRAHTPLRWHQLTRNRANSRPQTRIIAPPQAASQAAPPNPSADVRRHYPPPPPPDVKVTAPVKGVEKKAPPGWLAVPNRSMNYDT